MLRLFTPTTLVSAAHSKLDVSKVKLCGGLLHHISYIHSFWDMTCLLERYH